MTRDQIIDIVGDTVLIAIYRERDEESGQDYKSETELDGSRVFDELVNYRYRDEAFRAIFEAVEKLDRIRELLAEIIAGDWGQVSIVTKEANEKKKADDERRRLESLARGIAAREDVEIDSLEFIEALDRLADGLSWDRETQLGGEARAEHWAACQFSGAGRDTFYSDMDYTSGQFDRADQDLGDVRAWISKNCPLLWAQYQEKKLAEAAETVG